MPTTSRRSAAIADRAARLDRPLRLLVEVGADQRRVRLGARPCPLVWVVPSVPVLVAERDVFDVDQNFIGTRPVPDLPAGVARILQDRADGGGLPHLSVPVRVARPVV